MLYRVYVDEAGDRGIAARSSTCFIVAAVIVPDTDDAAVRQELRSLKQTLGRAPQHVLHFHKLTHPQKTKAAQDLATFSIATVASAIISKRALLGKDRPPKDLAHIARPDPMYLWALRLLLERISWFIRDHGNDGAKAIITFSHIKRFRPLTLHNYCQALMTSRTEIHWPAFESHPFRIESNDRVELLQLADTAASAIYRAIEPDQYGNTEPRYLSELRPVLYRRDPGDITSYGLKVFPAQECEPGASLAWLRAF